MTGRMDAMNRMGRRRCPLLLVVAALSACAAGAIGAGQLPLDPYYENRGLPGAARALRRVATGARVLYIAAHPDDEDSALVAYLSLGMGARVTYFSLTRGEGGQNAIGPEMGEALGVLRTEESLAARRIDGAHQLFGRAIDFGYSKSAEECFAKWGRENVVEDIARAIRMTRPQVVISRWQGTEQDGHGQHQAVGLAMAEAIAAAADDARFPRLVQQGLAPHQVQKFYFGSESAPIEESISIETSAYDPSIGRSTAAEGFRSRSQHRSQEMGAIQSEQSHIRILIPRFDDRPKDLLVGLEIDRLEERRTVGDIADRMTLEGETSGIADRVADLLREDRGAIWAEDDRADLHRALGNLLGIRIEAIAAAPRVIQGEGLSATGRLFAPDWAELSEVTLRLEGEAGASVGFAEVVPTRGELRAAWVAPLGAGFDFATTTPYFLRAESKGYNYVWSDGSIVGRAFEPPIFRANFQATHRGATMNLTAPVEHRWSESDFGERRADLVVAPPLGFKFDPPTRALRRGVPLSESGIGLIIENLSRNAIDAEVEIVAADASERRVGGKTIQLEAGERDRWRIEFDGADDNVGAFVAQWRYRVGRDHSWKPAYELQTIDYRHIRPRQIARPARLDVHEMNVTIPDGLRIGYVDAAGDGVGLVLEQLGVNVMWLDASALAAGEFGEFNAVLIASRAYEARPDLVEHNDRLLDYVRAGGNLVVQYQKYPVADLGVVPFEFAYARPHERVTVETARVRLLAPGHAALSWPHRIGAADFDGWVQERGLYFWSEWDERLTPLLEMSDPGEAPMRGALLHGRLGEGHYIYTGLAFFRQLPAGVEGAARLMVNLLSVGRDRGSRKGN